MRSSDSSGRGPHANHQVELGPAAQLRSFSDLAHETKEPIYITCNDLVSLVVMDAEAFDEVQEFRRQIVEHEIHVLDAFLQSEEEIRAGHTMSYDEYRRQRAAGRLSGGVK